VNEEGEVILGTEGAIGKGRGVFKKFDISKQKSRTALNTVIGKGLLKTENLKLQLLGLRGCSFIQGQKSQPGGVGKGVKTITTTVTRHGVLHLRPCVSVYSGECDWGHWVSTPGTIKQPLKPKMLKPFLSSQLPKGNSDTSSVTVIKRDDTVERFQRQE